MASSSDEVKKGLVLAAVVDAFSDPDSGSTVKEAEEDAKAVRTELNIIFTDDRGPTLMGAAQGEHATAYSLYVEFVMRLVRRYITAAEQNNHAGISDLLQEIKARPQSDNFLLWCFNLPMVEMDDFVDLELNIGRLRDKYNDRLGSLLKAIKPMQRLRMVSSANIPAEVHKEVQSLDPNALKKEINIVRAEYFYNIAQKIATEYLIFQNKSLHVAFRKIPGYEADSGEGARIRVALSMLKGYNQGNLGLTGSGVATSSRASLTRAGKAVSSQNPTIDQRIDEIVANIGILLFYPKIDEEGVVATTKKDAARGVLRSNDPRIFCFVVARHLSIIFATFEELGKDPKIKGAIIDRFIERMAKEWGYKDVESVSDKYASENIDKIKDEFINRKTRVMEWGEEDTESDPAIVKFMGNIDAIESISGIKTIIVAALKAAESSSNTFMYEGGGFEASVLEPSPYKESSAATPMAAMTSASNQPPVHGLASASAVTPSVQRRASGFFPSLVASPLRRFSKPSSTSKEDDGSKPADTTPKNKG